MERKPTISPREYAYRFEEFEVTLMLEKALRSSTQKIPPGKCRLILEANRDFILVVTEEMKDEQPGT